MVLESLLRDFLGEYIDINPDTFQCSFSSLTFREVALRPHLGDALGLPVRLSGGRVDLIQIRIPWTQLHRTAIELRLHGLVVDCQERDEGEWNAGPVHARAARARAAQLKARTGLERTLLSHSVATTTSNEMKTDSSWSSSLWTRLQHFLWVWAALFMGVILQRVHVTMADISLRLHTFDANLGLESSIEVHVDKLATIAHQPKRTITTTTTNTKHRTRSTTPRTGTDQAGISSASSGACPVDRSGPNHVTRRVVLHNAHLALTSGSIGRLERAGPPIVGPIGGSCTIEVDVSRTTSRGSTTSTTTSTSGRPSGPGDGLMQRITPSSPFPRTTPRFSSPPSTPSTSCEVALALRLDPIPVRVDQGHVVELQRLGSRAALWAKRLKYGKFRHAGWRKEPVRAWRYAIRSVVADHISEGRSPARGWTWASIQAGSAARRRFVDLYEDRLRQTHRGVARELTSPAAQMLDEIESSWPVEVVITFRELAMRRLEDERRRRLGISTSVMSPASRSVLASWWTWWWPSWVPAEEEDLSDELLESASEHESISGSDDEEGEDTTPYLGHPRRRATTGFTFASPGTLPSTHATNAAPVPFPFLAPPPPTPLSPADRQRSADRYRRLQRAVAHLWSNPPGTPRTESSTAHSVINTGDYGADDTDAVPTPYLGPTAKRFVSPSDTSIPPPPRMAQALSGDSVFPSPSSLRPSSSSRAPWLVVAFTAEVPGLQITAAARDAHGSVAALASVEVESVGLAAVLTSSLDPDRDTNPTVWATLHAMRCGVALPGLRMELDSVGGVGDTVQHTEKVQEGSPTSLGSSPPSDRDPYPHHAAVQVWAAEVCRRRGGAVTQTLRDLERPWGGDVDGTSSVSPRWWPTLHHNIMATPVLAVQISTGVEKEHHAAPPDADQERYATSRSPMRMADPTSSPSSPLSPPPAGATVPASSSHLSSPSSPWRLPPMVSSAPVEVAPNMSRFQSTLTLPPVEVVSPRLFSPHHSPLRRGRLFGQGEGSDDSEAELENEVNTVSPSSLGKTKVNPVHQNQVPPTVSASIRVGRIVARVDLPSTVHALSVLVSSFAALHTSISNLQEQMLRRLAMPAPTYLLYRAMRAIGGGRTGSGPPPALVRLHLHGDGFNVAIRGDVGGVMRGVGSSISGNGIGANQAPRTPTKAPTGKTTTSSTPNPLSSPTTSPSTLMVVLCAVTVDITPCPAYQSTPERYRRTTRALRRLRHGTTDDLTVQQVVDGVFWTGASETTISLSDLTVGVGTDKDWGVWGSSETLWTASTSLSPPSRSAPSLSVPAILVNCRAPGSAPPSRLYPNHVEIDIRDEIAITVGESLIQTCLHLVHSVKEKGDSSSFFTFADLPHLVHARRLARAADAQDWGESWRTRPIAVPDDAIALRLTTSATSRSNSSSSLTWHVAGGRVGRTWKTANAKGTVGGVDLAVRLDAMGLVLKRVVVNQVEGDLRTVAAMMRFDVGTISARGAMDARAKTVRDVRFDLCGVAWTVEDVIMSERGGSGTASTKTTTKNTSHGLLGMMGSARGANRMTTTATTPNAPSRPPPLYVQWGNARMVTTGMGENRQRKGQRASDRGDTIPRYGRVESFPDLVSSPSESRSNTKPSRSATEEGTEASAERRQLSAPSALTVVWDGDPSELARPLDVKLAAVEVVHVDPLRLLHAMSRMVDAARGCALSQTIQRALKGREIGIRKGGSSRVPMGAGVGVGVGDDDPFVVSSPSAPPPPPPRSPVTTVPSARTTALPSYSLWWAPEMVRVRADGATLVGKVESHHVPYPLVGVRGSCGPSTFILPLASLLRVVMLNSTATDHSRTVPVQEVLEKLYHLSPGSPCLGAWSLEIYGGGGMIVGSPTENTTTPTSTAPTSYLSAAKAPSDDMLISLTGDGVKLGLGTIDDTYTTVSLQVLRITAHVDVANGRRLLRVIPAAAWKRMWHDLVTLQPVTSAAAEEIVREVEEYAFMHEPVDVTAHPTAWMAEMGGTALGLVVHFDGLGLRVTDDEHGKGDGQSTYGSGAEVEGLSMRKKNTKHPPPSPPRQHEGFQHHQYQQLDLDMVGLAMGVAGFHFPCVGAPVSGTVRIWTPTIRLSHNGADVIHMGLSLPARWGYDEDEQEQEERERKVISSSPRGLVPTSPSNPTARHLHPTPTLVAVDITVNPDRDIDVGLRIGPLAVGVHLASVPSWLGMMSVLMLVLEETQTGRGGSRSSCNITPATSKGRSVVPACTCRSRGTPHQAGPSHLLLWKLGLLVDLVVQPWSVSLVHRGACTSHTNHTLTTLKLAAAVQGSTQIVSHLSDCPGSGSGTCPFPPRTFMTDHALRVSHVTLDVSTPTDPDMVRVSLGGGGSFTSRSVRVDDAAVTVRGSLRPLYLTHAARLVTAVRECQGAMADGQTPAPTFPLGPLASPSPPYYRTRRWEEASATFTTNTVVGARSGVSPTLPTLPATKMVLVSVSNRTSRALPLWCDGLLWEVPRHSTRQLPMDHVFASSIRLFGVTMARVALPPHPVRLINDTHEVCFAAWMKEDGRMKSNHDRDIPLDMPLDLDHGTLVVVSTRMSPPLRVRVHVHAPTTVSLRQGDITHVHHAAPPSSVFSNAATMDFATLDALYMDGLTDPFEVPGDLPVPLRLRVTRRDGRVLHATWRRDEAATTWLEITDDNNHHREAVVDHRGDDQEEKVMKDGPDHPEGITVEVASLVVRLEVGVEYVAHVAATIGPCAGIWRQQEQQWSEEDEEEKTSRSWSSSSISLSCDDARCTITSPTGSSLLRVGREMNPVSFTTSPQLLTAAGTWDKVWVDDGGDDDHGQHVSSSPWSSSWHLLRDVCVAVAPVSVAVSPQIPTEWTDGGRIWGKEIRSISTMFFTSTSTAKKSPTTRSSSSSSHLLPYVALTLRRCQVLPVTTVLSVDPGYLRPCRLRTPNLWIADSPRLDVVLGGITVSSSSEDASTTTSSSRRYTVGWFMKQIALGPSVVQVLCGTARVVGALGWGKIVRCGWSWCERWWHS